MTQQVICGIFLSRAGIGCAQKRAELGTTAHTRNLISQEVKAEESGLQNATLSQENNNKMLALGAFQILYFQIRTAQLISIRLLIDRNS